MRYFRQFQKRGERRGLIRCFEVAMTLNEEVTKDSRENKGFEGGYFFPTRNVRPEMSPTVKEECQRIQSL